MGTSDVNFNDEARESLLLNLREIIQWAQERDQSTAIRLDEVVHQLEVLAYAKGTEGLVEVIAERDAAWADLQRIKMIVLNPLQVIHGIGVDSRQAQEDAELIEGISAAQVVGVEQPQ